MRNTVRTFKCPFCGYDSVYDGDDTMERCSHLSHLVRYGDDGLVEYVVFNCSMSVRSEEVSNKR